jgi:hypothetical protein
MAVKTRVLPWVDNKLQVPVDSQTFYVFGSRLITYPLEVLVTYARLNRLSWFYDAPLTIYQKSGFYGYYLLKILIFL